MTDVEFETEDQPELGAPPREPRPGGSRLARRRKVLLGVGAGAALLSIGGLVGATFVKSPAQVIADAAPPPATVITAKASDQMLTATVPMRGVVYPTTQYTVSPSGSASSLYISKLDVASGATVTNGRLLAEVDGAPLFALTGGVPAWRDLVPGETGPDIAELQQALAALGHGDGSDHSGYFGAGTKEAVTAFFRSIGYTAPTTGLTSDQAVQAAQKTVETDEQGISQLEQGTQTTATRQQISAAQSQLSSDEQALSEAQAVDGAEVPQGDVVFLPTLPATIIAVNGAVGQQAPSPMLDLTTSQLALTGELPPAFATQLKPGMTVQIYDEATGIRATGTVGGIGPSSQLAPAGTTVAIGGAAGASSSSGSGSASGQVSGPGGSSFEGGQQNQVPAYIPVTITPNAPLPAALNGENVLVTVQTNESTGAVLAVPVAAIFTKATGQTDVTVVGAGGKQTNVPVTTGVTANGYVQVTPTVAGALVAGDNVVVGA